MGEGGVMSPLRRLAVAGASAVMVLLPLAAAPAASAAPGDDAAVVNAWYTDFLDRPAHGDPGARYWVDRLGVQAPADVAWALTHTREHNATRIADYYRWYLDREPDAGARYWVEGTTAGRFPLEWVEQNILASDEYARLHAPASEANLGQALAEAWYVDALHRDFALPSDLPYWAQRIAAVGRLGALREMWYSPEGVTGRIVISHQALLERGPDVGEAGYWYPKEVESDVNVQVLIAATPEYRALSR